MKERSSVITNFIGVFDNYLPEIECKKAIQLFEEQDKFNKTMDRMQFEASPVNEKKDKQLFLAPYNLNMWWSQIKPLIVNFELAFQHYNKETGILNAYGLPSFHYTDIKIQKTLPTEGYHLWHIEHMQGYDNEPRAAVFSIYLNDIEEGGETEFLHFSKRVKPKTGRIVIWPAGFPYVHRGNPPLSGEKYIITSWLKVRP
tara:strand:+ start:1200 stop:1799 length:600 start_codon:yes stop_codon:yes gene_type:complete